MRGEFRMNVVTGCALLRESLGSSAPLLFGGLCKVMARLPVLPEPVPASRNAQCPRSWAPARHSTLQPRLNDFADAGAAHGVT